jgi:hypothetical protein
MAAKALARRTEGACFPASAPGLKSPSRRETGWIGISPKGAPSCMRFRLVAPQTIGSAAEATMQLAKQFYICGGLRLKDPVGVRTRDAAEILASHAQRPKPGLARAIGRASPINFDQGWALATSASIRRIQGSVCSE